MEPRRARLVSRRAVVWVAIAAPLAAAAFIADSLRRSVAQLSAAVPVVVQRDEETARPRSDELVSPRAEHPAPSLEAAAASEQEDFFEIESDQPLEGFEPEQLASPGPLTGAEFAELLESGALGDVGADADAAAELRRALEAAAFEAELEPSEP